MKRPISEQKWIRIACDEALIRQKGRCRYCDKRLRRSEATADHYQSRRNFGSSEKENIVAACLACNQAKASLNGDEFLRLIKQRDPEAHYYVKVQAVMRRLELRTQQAERRILSIVALKFERAA